MPIKPISSHIICQLVENCRLHVSCVPANLRLLPSFRPGRLSMLSQPSVFWRGKTVGVCSWKNALDRREYLELQGSQAHVSLCPSAYPDWYWNWKIRFCNLQPQVWNLESVFYTLWYSLFVHKRPTFSVSAVPELFAGTCYTARHSCQLRRADILPWVFLLYCP